MPTVRRQSVWQRSQQHSMPFELFQGQTGVKLHREHIPVNTATSTSALKVPQIKFLIIFGSVIVLSLFAALTGCIVACCHKKRKTVSKKAPDAKDEAHRNSSPPMSSSSSEGNPTDSDVEMFAHLNAIMASEAFEGREWSAYKKELKRKARRRARGVERTSQGITLPMQIYQLRDRMTALSRNFTRSASRSDTSQQTQELGALNEILGGLERIAGVIDSGHVDTKPQSPKPQPSEPQAPETSEISREKRQESENQHIDAAHPDG